MLNSIKRFAAGLLIAVLLTGTFSVTTAEAALARPANCHFVRWNNKKFTSCRIGWNKVSNADGYEIKWTYTNNSHYKHTYQYYVYNVLDINDLAYNHVLYSSRPGPVLSVESCPEATKSRSNGIQSTAPAATIFLLPPIPTDPGAGISPLRKRRLPLPLRSRDTRAVSSKSIRITICG